MGDFFSPKYYKEVSNTAIVQISILPLISSMWTDDKVSPFYICRVLHHEDPYPGLFSNQIVKLFGATFVSGSVLLHQMETLFFMLR